MSHGMVVEALQRRGNHKLETKTGNRKANASATRTQAGQALFEVVIETAGTFFRLREAGKRTGGVTSWGGGLWGVLRSLHEEGPQTVPQIARTRPVARQRIQRLANEMAAAGLVEFIDNPAHRRSKLVHITPQGEAHYEDIRGRIAALCDELAREMDEGELRTTARVLARIRETLAAQSISPVRAAHSEPAPMDQPLVVTLRPVLRTLAAEGRTITYRDLIARAEILPPQRIHRLTLALEQLIREDHAAERPLLAVLAVSKVTDGLPGPGFFHLCAELGLYDGPDRGPEATAFHTRELARAWAYWGGEGD